MPSENSTACNVPKEVGGGDVVVVLLPLQKVRMC